MSTRQFGKPSFTSASEINSAITPLQGSLPSLWQRLFHWEENLTVAGRTINKGWVVPQPLGIALIVVMLGTATTFWYRTSDRIQTQDASIHELKELAIRMDQRLMDKEKADDKEQRDRKDENELQDLKIQDLKDKILVLNAKRR